VAVAGIIAFNTIKTQQGPPPPILPEAQSAKVVPAIPANSEGSTIVAPTGTDEPRIAKAVAKPVAKDERRTDQAKPAETNSIKSDGAKTYIVAKGDNPVSIARKFKVPYDNLMAANNIEDPHKLKIGQKLIIPNKPTKQKKPD
jgi:2',3'-cyclic-nucleotide 2'-phosphodiesterase/3'-nucleotidase